MNKQILILDNIIYFYSYIMTPVYRDNTTFTKTG